MNLKSSIIFLFSLSFLFSCKKDVSYIETKLLGHAGNGMEQWNGMYAANSLESIKYALNLDKCTGVEIDIQISADSTLWVMHDTDLSKKTNRNGCVNESSDAFLETVRYKSIHQEKLTTLEAVLNLHSSKEIVLDLKHYSDCFGNSVSLTAIQSAFNRLPPFPSNFYLNMNIAGLYPYVKDLGLPLIYEIKSVSDAAFAFDKPEIIGFMFDANHITADEIAFLKSRNYKVYLFGVRSIKRLRQELKRKPDYILVDDLVNSVIEI